jgi:hypothetical protein
MSAAVEFIRVRKNTMSYFKDAEVWLDKVLSSLPKDKRADAKKTIKAKLLESYRNGQSVGAKEKKPAEGKGKEPKAYRVVVEHLEVYFVEAESELAAREEVEQAIEDGSLGELEQEKDAPQSREIIGTTELPR